MGKASMTDAEPPEKDSILTTETTQITVPEERSVFLLENFY